MSRQRFTLKIRDKNTGIETTSNVKGKDLKTVYLNLTGSKGYKPYLLTNDNTPILIGGTSNSTILLYQL